MPNISIQRGLLLNCTDEVTGLLDELMTIPKEVQFEMLKAEADIIADEQRKTAQEMLTVNTGEYYDEATGVRQAIAVGRMKKNRNDNLYHTNVIFKGKQHGERLGAIAFYNEYGVLHMGRGSFDGEARLQRPRPFIQTANNRAFYKAIKAAEKIFLDYVRNKSRNP